MTYIKPSLDFEDDVKPGFIESICNKNYRKATFIGCSVSFANCMSGMNVINGFAKEIFEKIEENGGETKLDPSQSSLILGISAVVGVLVSMITVKYMRRKSLLLAGHILLCIFLTLVGIFIDKA